MAYRNPTCDVCWLLARLIAGFGPPRDSRIHASLSQYRSVKYASIHIQMSARVSTFPLSSLLPRVSRESLALIAFRRSVISRPRKRLVDQPFIPAGDFKSYLAHPCIPLCFSAALLLSLNTKDRGFPMRLFSVELIGSRTIREIRVVSLGRIVSG